MAKDKILTYQDYQDEPFPRLNNSHQDYESWLRGMYELFQGEAAPDIPSERETSVKAYVNAGRWLMAVSGMQCLDSCRGQAIRVSIACPLWSPVDMPRVRNSGLG